MPSPATTTKKRGRRKGRPVSRDAVLRAAKRQFAKHGYAKTTLRAIARDARVDPSMLLYLFGSKAELFRESMRLVLNPEVIAGAFAGDEKDVGYRVVRTYLQMWEEADTAATMVAMLASATSNRDAHEAFRSFVQNYVQTAVSAALGGGEEARLRATLAATSLVGTAMLRYVMAVPPLSSLSTDEVVELVGPVVHRFLTGDYIA